ncbi:glycosyltransferase [Candidatus Saccharibacteria bacterium]|nr:glycosyltransferase [Candidatus Saccharibacteria bacterium]
MSNPLLSIVIPVWNNPRSIKNIASSILSQSFDDFELILVDDGSTDDTLQNLRDIAETDSRVKVITKPNGGPSSARNLGLDEATGKYIQFFDSDDDIKGGSLSLVVSEMEQRANDMVVSGWQIDLPTKSGSTRPYKQISPTSQVFDGDIKKSIIRSLGDIGTLYNLWNKLFRANIIREHGLRFREDLWFGEDLVFALNYLEHAKRVDIIPDITYCYLTNAGGSVVGHSSLVPEYRVANDEEIVKFAGNTLDNESRDLLNWLRRRWVMSFWITVSRSDKSLSEKRKLIRKVNIKGIKTVWSPKYIGLKHWLIGLILAVVKTSTIFILIFGSLANLAKNLIKSLKLTLRK